jgi:hypothetical protein
MPRTFLTGLVVALLMVSPEGAAAAKPRIRAQVDIGTAVCGCRRVLDVSMHVNFGRSKSQDRADALEERYAPSGAGTLKIAGRTFKLHPAPGHDVAAPQYIFWWFRSTKLSTAFANAAVNQHATLKYPTDGGRLRFSVESDPQGPPSPITGSRVGSGGQAP